MKHIWKVKGLLLPKRIKMWWNRNRSFKKYHRNCSLRTSTKGSLLRTFNGYSFNFNGGLCNCRTDFCPCRAPVAVRQAFSVSFEVTSCDFTPSYSFFDSTKHLPFEMCVVGTTIAKLCPNMIHFGALNFSERRSEEVMFLLTLSVQYISPWIAPVICLCATNTCPQIWMRISEVIQAANINLIFQFIWKTL